MDSNELNRMKQLAGVTKPTAPVTEDTSNVRLQDIVATTRMLTESADADERALSKADKEAQDKKDVSVKKAPWDESVEESADERALTKADKEAQDKKDVSVKKAPWESVEEDIDAVTEEKDEDGNWIKPWEKKDEATEEVDEDDEVTEGAKPDFSDIDDDGDEEETAKKAAKDAEVKETSGETMRRVMDSLDVNEWSNSPAGRTDERESVSDQPEGEVVDLSLRRYLNADPSKVTVAETDLVEADMLREYAEFKEEEQLDELSPETLGRYTDAAKKDKRTQRTRATRNYDKGISARTAKSAKARFDSGDKAHARADKRGAGISMADKKLNPAKVKARRAGK